jgi:hypothetical protein
VKTIEGSNLRRRTERDQGLTVTGRVGPSPLVSLKWLRKWLRCGRGVARYGDEFEAHGLRPNDLVAAADALAQDYDTDVCRQDDASARNGALVPVQSDSPASESAIPIRSCRPACRFAARRNERLPGRESGSLCGVGSRSRRLLRTARPDCPRQLRICVDPADPTCARPLAPIRGGLRQLRWPSGTHARDNAPRRLATGLQLHRG